MIIAVINIKGGTGKTTTSVSLGAAFAERGYEVLVVDLDPQAAASISLGATPETLQPSVSDVLFDGKGIKSIIRSASQPHLHFLPADPYMYNADLLLARTPGCRDQLGKALAAVEDDYDFILCDCPPSFSLISANALVAADVFLLPVTPDYLALEEVGSVLGIVEEARRKMGATAELLGIVLTMTPRGPKSKAAQENMQYLRECYGEDVFTTEISMDGRLADSAAYGTTIFGTDPMSSCAEEYRALAEELIQRCGVLKLKAESRRITRLRQRGRGRNTWVPREA